MKISFNWLKQLIKTDKNAEEIAEILTDLGLEVEHIYDYQSIKGGLKGVVIGEVIQCEKHPDADKLKVTLVHIGQENPLQIVCGASNVAIGQKVAVATIGTILYDKEGKEWKINKGKIRGVESHGMLCAEDELGIGNSHDGILVLDPKNPVGKPLAELLDIENDETIEIGLTPNRADAMSHYGVARDLRAKMMVNNNSKVELITPSVNNFKVDIKSLKIDVDVKNYKQTPRYCSLTISNVVVKDSPDWIKNRLNAIGIVPKNNIVDITNYVMHELGQPLHAFDASKISGKIEVKNVADGTKIITLDDIERTLHSDDILICDEKGPLCIAGVYGGKKSGVTEKTTNIFLESAYFDPVSIRKTSKRLGINSDASFRFERGVDINLTEFALKRAALLIKEYSNGEITSDIIDIYPHKIEDFKVVLNYEKVFKIIGQEISKETIKQILAALEIKVNSITETGLGLQIPSYRVDVQREIDVIEEILRVYGYNNIDIPIKINAAMSQSNKTSDYKIQNIIANQLVAQGFNEIMCNSLTSLSYFTENENFQESRNVKILNPLSNDLGVLKQSMLFSGLESLSYNINRKNSNLKLFEFGKTYHKDLNGYVEPKHLSMFITGYKNEEHWLVKKVNSNFYQLKSYIIGIINRLGIEKIEEKPSEFFCFSDALSFANHHGILVEFGIVKKSILKEFDIKQDVFYADFNWDLILKSINTKIIYKEIPKFPEAKRDLALLLDNHIKYIDLYQKALKTEKTLLKNITLFDVYEGNQLPEGKKSYALSFILQDENKTLTDEQIDKTITKIQKVYQEELGAILR
ncbi:MAG: phenylalanine--tRNA ligase subunit beta [Flavobacterium sp.]